MSLIKSNQLCAGQKLPSTREISVLFQINRITVSKAYEELQTQGWLKSFVGCGTFVSPHIPEAEPEVLRNVSEKKTQKVAGFPIFSQSNFDLKLSTVNRELHLDDGFPDPKLAPLKELYRAYRNQLTKGGFYYKYGCYANPAGSDVYREAISDYLNKTRGLKTTAKNIISVKGTIMGINLVCNGLIDAGDVIVSGVPGWGRAERNFIHAKAEHITIPVDENGLMIDALKNICRKKSANAICNASSSLSHNGIAAN
ncbi:aminotransferase class I/II-fold pyridoxal phosphate-dependent enzyme [Elizabethkingia argenteiflava]|uniref:aminotransferase class I/II-fold pyridoxal phosphate-dependent enzyme n=1 Tax=Elizabethkingia argenteiflava TaxID=2681556 RepID=UPI001BB3A520|nr:aminotransferase class I/II-fold pyridoxal phosphate-dependent enzyme [Elizabethkingia argenteiflava]